MTLTEFRYIVAVARERHFGRAAEACHVSQPTLSVAVKKLEEELGVVLFERSKTEVSITPVGDQVVRQAQRVLEEADSLTTIARQGRDQLCGPLRLGAIHTIGPYLLPHLVPEVHRRAPKLPLIIEENYTARLAESLKQGELDAIIVAMPFEQPGVVTLPLYSEPFVAVLPADHPLSRRQKLDINELARETLLLLGAGHCFREQVLHFCPDCHATMSSGNSIQHTVEGSSLETIRHMVVTGMGVTILPCSAAGADRYAQHLLSIRRFQEPVPTRQVALAWRTSFPRPKAIEVIRQAILDTHVPCLEMIGDPSR
ncbi:MULTISPECIES: hydrogen peroxide-inducible genes activator [Ectothiorhodospira]|uniref:LysR family transcriptional regulator, hydrogen peroxide-inducible genes activator n=1 Tax=Ectothiorhodospira marina TaxID=1396821 RepID=A0A1H7IHH0_9GAMM|nr:MULTISPECIES: hydrogen peroxide-inducible genes activator [Ectothiorhodospira]MCG5515173.1 hydrogen peroxide-inducible genes activator [Ectothiorhodospira sp. 9100]MCG5519516.1 hydrogen peroxide-inducible genes activator [Ectothiorhodospira sp. 9905]SEK61919.1 LysR family transcriptional regulator, hydrogen peroxide-inducible genes activator [Ectothiorhodospira marina]